MSLIQGEHSYWASLRTPDESYWRDSGMKAQGAKNVAAVTLDDVVRERRLNGPFLLKFDVQGGELEALKGARDVLTKTSLIVIEVHCEDFNAVHTHLDRAGFDLFDITDIGRNLTGNFAWCYGVYLERSLMAGFASPLWTPEDAALNVAHQHKFRAEKLKRNAQLLNALRGKS